MGFEGNRTERRIHSRRSHRWFDNRDSRNSIEHYILKCSHNGIMRAWKGIKWDYIVA